MGDLSIKKKEDTLVETRIIEKGKEIIPNFDEELPNFPIYKRKEIQKYSEIIHKLKMPKEFIIEAPSGSGKTSIFIEVSNILKNGKKDQSGKELIPPTKTIYIDLKDDGRPIFERTLLQIVGKDKRKSNFNK